MKRINTRIVSNLFWLVLLGCFVVPVSVYGALLYKSYVVRNDRGNDILCDPYTVQKNDFVIKLFKQRGEISERDFPEFLNIFKRLNPHIRNINRILPGQNILIPLKKLGPDALPGQATGIVSIPFVTLSNVEDLLKTFASSYRVKRGDSVSQLISKQFGNFGSVSYNEGIQLFKVLNPRVKNLNRIYRGQMLHIPDSSLRDQPWYDSLLDDSGNLINIVELKDLLMKEQDAPASVVMPPETVPPESTFSKAAAFLNAKLLSKGNYFFPKQDGGDVELDLSRFPVMEFRDGTKLIFSKAHTISRTDQDIIKSYWPNVKMVSADQTDPLERVLDAVFLSLKKGGQKDRLSFTDDGVVVEVRARWMREAPSSDVDAERWICITPIQHSKERTSDTIIRYLAKRNIIIEEQYPKAEDTTQTSKVQPIHHTPPETVRLNGFEQRTFVADFLAALDYQYSQKCQITFPYAGIQIAAVSNLVSRNDGRPLLIDFGDFYGEAILALEKTGFEILQIGSNDGVHTLVPTMLNALNLSYTSDPTFLAAKRSDKYNTSLTIPGYLIPEARASQVLIASTSLNDEVIQFLKEQGITVIMISDDTLMTRVSLTAQ